MYNWKKFGIACIAFNASTFMVFYAIGGERYIGWPMVPQLVLIVVGIIAYSYSTALRGRR